MMHERPRLKLRFWPKMSGSGQQRTVGAIPAGVCSGPEADFDNQSGTSVWSKALG
jgi:hypothetical protein